MTKGSVPPQKNQNVIFFQKGGGVDPKVYISKKLLFEFFLFKLGVNSENRLQNEFLWYKDGLL